jgi:rhamnosyltransferase subunit B
MARLVLITQGTGGDFFPFLRMGARLRDRGHDVSLLTHSLYAHQVQDAGLAFVPIDTRELIEARILDLGLLESPQGVVPFYQRHVLPSLVPEIRIVESACRTRDAVLVAHHDCQTTAQFASERLGLGMVRVFTAPHFARVLSLLGEVHGMLASQFNATRETLGLPPVHDWTSWMKAPRRSLGFWPDWFEPEDADAGTDIRRVGFLLTDGPAEGALSEQAAAVLDGREAPILITHGTSRPGKAAFFESSVRACEELGVRGLLVTRHEDVVPRPLPACVAWIASLPFGSAMPRAAAVIHHGGIGTLAQGLAAGIPQLILGLGFDRPDNGARLTQLGAGAYLPPARWEASSVAKTLRCLIADAGVRSRCQQLAARMGGDPVTAACGAIEDLLKEPDGLTIPHPSQVAPGEEGRRGDGNARRSPLLSESQRAVLVGRLRKRGRSGAGAPDPLGRKPA